MPSGIVICFSKCSKEVLLIEKTSCDILSMVEFPKYERVTFPLPLPSKEKLYLKEEYTESISCWIIPPSLINPHLESSNPSLVEMLEIKSVS